MSTTISTISAAVRGGAESPSPEVHGILLDRFRSLEASHEKLKEQFDILLQETEGLGGPTHHNITPCNDVVRRSSWVDAMGEYPGGEAATAAEEELEWCYCYIQGRFDVSPYGSALNCMGHALYICRADSGEIIYWNRAAEKLYGYKDYEALGQTDEDLIVDERHSVVAGKINERMRFIRAWSGQIPYRKRSGQMFMAIVTKSQLYEDGEFLGVITISSDAAVFNNMAPGIMRLGADGKFRRLIPQNLNWSSNQMVSSSVSNQASKVELQNEEDNGEGGFFNMWEKDRNDRQVDVRPPREPATKPRFSMRFPGSKGGTFADVEPLENEESANETSQPVKFAKKVFSKLQMTGISRFNRGKEGNVQQNDFSEIPFSRRKVIIEPISPEEKPETTLCSINKHSQAVAKTDSESSGKNTVPSSARKGYQDGHTNSHREINWEDLQLHEEVGQGSFAVVYHGIWNGSDVAVKVYHGTEISEETLTGYSKELDIMKRLRHPNVLLFMGAVCTNEKLALVTEFLPRGSLFKVLHRNSQHLDLRRRLRMALDVARGMSYLHHRNPPIVHRDLKTSNLLVDKSWTVKVGDFGLSKLKEATFLTAKSGRGTPQWMAPEVLRNEPSTEKSDVYSYGVILWELMTDSIPWKNLNPLQVVGAVGFMDRRLDIPATMDPKITSIIEDCWQSNAENRPSFKDLIQIMVDIIQALPGGAPGRSPRI